MQVVVGRVAKAHGLHGELAVDVRTDSPRERFAQGKVLLASLRDGVTKRVTVAAVRPHGGRLLVRFAEAQGRTAAEELRGAMLLVDTADLPQIEDPDEFYDHELEGLRAELTDGTVIGTVREVIHSPGGELLAVDRDDHEALVPFVAAIVVLVDVTGGRVVIDPPEGLLDS
ncbi:16S rRNA processing protein RimM [Saccharomonospora marina XMU15]|uniref:Ribosome maturation factor RimM n=1 Tax=Saccharomonospora marina XMU15 TaxID=882083 RepID=H5WZI1_9PSEU|nr:ribosome maturation factor RimM [Saccharomonospora marina]EHR49643.1 16S rRNA processing protein RimM [Saccharomonospora marina XMU15]